MPTDIFPPAPSPKKYTGETERSVSPAETLERIMPFAKKCGITRIADITKLDRIGIPVFSCIRPGAAEGAISVYNGKGMTEDAARVSAVMEGIERYSSEINDRELTSARFSELGEGKALNPADLILPDGVNPDMILPWCRCFDITNDTEILVPAHAVYHPVPHEHGRFFRTNTNGIASGNTAAEAVYYGLCEVIERDSWSLAEAAHTGGAVIDKESIIDEKLNAVLKKFADEEIEITLRDITGPAGIPAVAAVCDDTRLKDPALLCIGMGAHLVPEIAALRAVTEAAQSRATQIHGAREDTVEADFRRRLGYDRTKRLNRRWFEVPESKDDMRNFSEIPSFKSDDFLKDIRYISGKLREAGLDRIIAADLTMPDTGVTVVRVIVPGAEVYALDNTRIGKRCMDAGRSRIHRSQH